MKEIIAVIGDAKQCSETYERIVRLVGAQADVENDQDHPTVIQMAFPLDKVLEEQELALQEEIVRACGATSIIVADEGADDEILSSRLFSFGHTVVDGQLNQPELSQEAVDYIGKIRRRYGQVIGVVGGMGPQAGADSGASLMKLGAPCVVLGNCDIPDRTKFLIGDGEDFVPEMQKSFSVLEMLADKAVVTCNTAHAGLSRIVSSLECIDIRDAALDKLEEGCEKAILFATSGTLQSGVYEAKAEERGVDLVKPGVTSLEQALVMGAIYGENSIQAGFSEEIVEEARTLLKGSQGIKGGDNGLEGQAKSALVHAADLIRSNNSLDERVPIFLSCTELPLVFTPDEMKEYNLIDSSMAMIEKARDFSRHSLPVAQPAKTLTHQAF